MTFVLMPYVGTELIGEDLGPGYPLEEAYNQMMENCRTGRILHPECDEDDEVDVVCRKSIATFKLARERTRGKRRDLDTNAEHKEPVLTSGSRLLESDQPPSSKEQSRTAEAIADELFPQVKMVGTSKLKFKPPTTKRLVGRVDGNPVFFKYSVLSYCANTCIGLRSTEIQWRYWLAVRKYSRMDDNLNKRGKTTAPQKQE
ncbi:hypothetical protein JVT61DRAFT_9098 [Boletus reticuloceps]|uniref:Uncharacterized protein n=1 Tax=Boletus reticuloceps TaxID=495285 RepID=A0A8I2YH85_9AGAM|nr:hypothetical protein JVT61DRAFT_9098 [Boletus reticuloceps]